jgi:DNA-binding transcriptional regulator YdaS (Cro superfamily)
MQNGTGILGIKALRQAIREHLRTQVALAHAVGVTPQAVSDVLKRGKRVPAEWCLKLEQATGGAIPAHALRPDLYPPKEKQGEKQ